jgi:hypothetical protein
MASSLDQKQVEELIEKYRALAEKGQRRIDELEERNEHLVDAIRSSLLVPTSAFAMSYARAYYGESSSIFGIPIDAMVGMLLKGFAALLGFSSDKGAQVAAKVAHDVANGALASWSSAMGAELGLKKRLEKPVPTPQPNTGAAKVPSLSSRALTHEDLAAITGAMAVQANVPAQVPQPAMPPRPPLNGQPAPVMTSATHVATTALSSTPQKPFRFTQRWAVDPEADMRALLQSAGAPADPNTVNHLLTHENPGDEFKVTLRRARAPT